MAKQRRNDLCACGSGIKFKKCCGSLAPARDVDERVEAAIRLALEDDRALRNAAVDQLRVLRETPDLSPKTLSSINMSLIQALQRIGDHHSALAILDTLPDAPSDWNGAMQRYLRARSLERLGRFAEAVSIFEEVMPVIQAVAPDQYPYYLIEFGRAYSSAGRSKDAISAWEQCVALFTSTGTDKEHLSRARANIGIELLYSDDEADQKRGEALLYETADEKAMLGDLEGLTNNYSALSMYYRKVRRWERAIAFARRDLKLTRLIGDEHQLCATLCNIAAIYIEMLQLSSARRCLEEARAIGLRLGYGHTLEMVEVNLATATLVGREAGLAGSAVGPKAACRCKSGQTYENCCGRADFEPDTPLLNFDETPNSEGITFRNMMPLNDTRRLDRILAPDTSNRFSWTSVHTHDGWMEVGELPDVANYHLTAARNLAHTRSPQRFDEPLAACVLSVCAAEAFINTVCFFVTDTAHHAAPHQDSLLGRAAALIGDALNYQRRTELTEKWSKIGGLLAGDNWISDKAWRAFVTLVSVRNELVHFKAANYEQVSPAPKHLHENLRRLPPEVELRDVPHSWPARLLTSSFAQWSVSTVEDLIDALKAGYARTYGTAASSDPEQVLN